MMFGWVIIVFVVLILIWFLSRGKFELPGRVRKDKTPMEVLEDRFARGEINKEEFEEAKRLLREK